MPEVDVLPTVVPCGGCGYPTLGTELCSFCTEVMASDPPAA